MRETFRVSPPGSNVVFIGVGERRGQPAPALTAQISAIAALALSVAAAVYLLTEAIVAWIGGDRGYALIFLSTL